MNDIQIVKPVFIVGSERSGTTLIYNLLARHSDFAWFSNWTNLIPSLPQLAILSRLSANITVSFLTQRRFWPEPAMEGIKIHKHCGIHDLLWEKQRVLSEIDVDSLTTACFTKIIHQHLKWQNRARFIHKNVNNSMRILYLKTIFPHAKFIHVIRHGMAVALSLNNVAFWKGIDLWWTDFTPDDWAAEGNDPLVLCGLHWNKQIETIKTSVKHLPAEQYFEIQYENFVQTPLQALMDITHFCELEQDQHLEKLVAQKNICNLNTRWQESSSDKSLRLLWETIQDTAETLGYSNPL